MGPRWHLCLLCCAPLNTNHSQLARYKMWGHATWIQDECLLRTWQEVYGVLRVRRSTFVRAPEHEVPVTAATTNVYRQMISVYCIVAKSVRAKVSLTAQPGSIRDLLRVMAAATVQTPGAMARPTVPWLWKRTHEKRVVDEFPGGWGNVVG